MSAVATTEKETEIAKPAPKPIVNPLMLDATAVAVARMDGLVTGFIEDAVGQIDDEVTRMMRRREVSSAVRGIIRVKKALDEAVAGVAETGMPELVLMTLDGEREDLLTMYRTLNPAAEDDKIEEVVEALMEGYRGKLTPPSETTSDETPSDETPSDEKPKRGRRAAAK